MDKGVSEEKEEEESDENVLNDLPEGDDGWEYLNNGDEDDTQMKGDAVESQGEPEDGDDHQRDEIEAEISTEREGGHGPEKERDDRDSEQELEAETVENGTAEETSEEISEIEEDEDSSSEPERTDVRALEEDENQRGEIEAESSTEREGGHDLETEKDEKESEQELEAETAENGTAEETSEEISEIEDEDPSGPEDTDVRALEKAILDGDKQALSDAVAAVKSEVRKGHVISFVRNAEGSVPGSFAPGGKWGDTPDKEFIELGWVDEEGKTTAQGASVLARASDIIEEADGLEVALVGYLNSEGVETFFGEAMHRGPDEEDDGGGFIGNLLG